MWSTIGRWIGRGIVYALRHPELLDGIVGAVTAAKAAREGDEAPAPKPDTAA